MSTGSLAAGLDIWTIANGVAASLPGTQRGRKVEPPVVLPLVVIGGRELCDHRVAAIVVKRKRRCPRDSFGKHDFVGSRSAAPREARFLPHVQKQFFGSRSRMKAADRKNSKTSRESRTAVEASQPSPLPARRFEESHGRSLSVCRSEQSVQGLRDAYFEAAFGFAPRQYSLPSAQLTKTSILPSPSASQITGTPAAAGSDISQSAAPASGEAPRNANSRPSVVPRRNSCRPSPSRSPVIHPGDVLPTCSDHLS